VKQANKVLAEFFGTALLLLAIVGSGILATTISDDVGIQLIINVFSIVTALGLLIFILGPVSGAHLNPVVSLVMFGRRELSLRDLINYLPAQILGAIAGTALANVLWNQPALQVSTKIRTSLGMWIGEVLATAGLLAIILVLKRRKQDHLIIVAVPAWITSAIFFTPSTSFANPAVTIGRMFSDTFAGIAPESAWLFISAQLVGALIVFVFFRITEHDSTKERVSK
jgi:glycerol uptake facilitator-like aquaporin